MSIWKALIPYILVALLLVITRVRELGIYQILSKYSFGFKELFNSSVSYSFSPLLNPGIVPFILVVLLVCLFMKINPKKMFMETSQKLSKALVTLIFAIATVQVMIFSGSSGINSMPLIVGKFLASSGKIYPLFAPLLGAFGSFMAGSSTVSNLFFGAFQKETAVALGISSVLVLSLQAVGSAIGNMIAVHNIIAASATVGLRDVEGVIIRYNIFPVLIYALLAGIVGLLL